MAVRLQRHSVAFPGAQPRLADVQGASAYITTNDKVTVKGLTA